MSESSRLIPAGNNRQINGGNSNGSNQVSINMNYKGINGYVS